MNNTPQRSIKWSDSLLGIPWGTVGQVVWCPGLKTMLHDFPWRSPAYLQELVMCHCHKSEGNRENGNDFTPKYLCLMIYIIDSWGLNEWKPLWPRRRMTLTNDVLPIQCEKHSQLCTFKLCNSPWILLISICTILKTTHTINNSVNHNKSQW